MNDIKFRVWCKTHKEWEKHATFLTQNGKLWHPLDSIRNLVPCRENSHVVCLYTGLKDINGREIYEGDICRHGYTNNYGNDFYNNSVVAYFEKDCCFGLVKHSYNPKMYNRITENMIKRNNIEVIGNLYENPELLKEVQ